VKFNKYEIKGTQDDAVHDQSTYSKHIYLFII